MAGDILIIDCIPTNRIILKVKLLAAQYRVRPCGSVAEAKAEIAASPPDLILLDTSAHREDALAFCQDMKGQDDTYVIPIIALGGFPTPRDRVAALKAGADDIVGKPFDDHILQARIRSLLRARDARQELRMREGTRTALGFAEASAGFERPSHVVVAAADDMSAQQTVQTLLPLGQITASTADLDDMRPTHDGRTATDLYILDFRAGLTDEAQLYRILSNLRSTSVTRHASILVRLPVNAGHAAGMALDLGANDVVCVAMDPDELRHRARTLIAAKTEADALRRTVESGLEAAITDPLTGLFNRRYAMPHLKRLSDEAHKSGRQFALMVLDLDHFKRINDTHGHAAGDQVLQQVADRLRGNLRAVDLLARIGGEEFLVAIPNSDAVHARTAAERLCDLISATPFYVGPEQKAIPVTMSVGVSLGDGAVVDALDRHLDDMMNEADIALYAAKNGGRNKVSLSAA